MASVVSCTRFASRPHRSSMNSSVDSPLRQPVTYFAGHREVSKLEPPDDVNVVIGISHKSFPMNATDALWEKYALGETWKIKDPQTGKASTRNIFLGAATGAAGSTVRGLQARGVVFWQCNFALGSRTANCAGGFGGEWISGTARRASGSSG